MSIFEGLESALHAEDLARTAARDAARPPAVYDRAKYGPAVTLQIVGMRSPPRRPKQKYPNNTQRLYRANGITPADAAKGRSPEGLASRVLIRPMGRPVSRGLHLRRVA